MEIARRLGDVEIVTVDSMQVYRGMDIGTAKPALAERGGVTHHLVDVADPGEEWSLTRWVDQARAAVAAIESRGHRALLVGGSGLYVQAFVDGLEPPPRYPDVLADRDAEPDTATLHRRLAALDPRAAARIEPANRRRVLRALEVTIGSGRPFSASGPGIAAYPPTSWRLAAVWLPRQVVAGRIARRLAAMLDAGLVAEVTRLVGRPGGLSRTARQALGYREVLSHLEDGVDLSEAHAEAVRRTQAFAWFAAADNPLAVIPTILGEWAVR